MSAVLGLLQAGGRQAMRLLGAALRPIRPGIDSLATERRPRRPALTVTSALFKEGGRIPRLCSADGEGRFPGIAWDGLPEGTRSVVVLVQDADIPLPYPVTHLIVHSIPPDVDELPAGSVSASMREPAPAGWRTGRNFLGGAGWTPPAPPPGHGPHRYAFQVFALDGMPTFRHAPRRYTLLRRMEGHVLAQGRLIGTYERS